MKPNYCAGESFVSGRFPTFTSSSATFNKNHYSRSRSLDRLGLQQQQQQSHNNSASDSSKDSLGNSYTYSTAARTSSSSPFIVYRSAKYVRPHARALQTVQNYAKYYVGDPAALIGNRCKDAFYQLFGLLILLVTFPLWMLGAISLFIVRRLRYLLIRRFHPNVVQLNHWDSYSPFTPETSGIVNFIVWTKGKLDASTIQKRFKLLFTENPQLYSLLTLKLTSRLGTKVWEGCESFALESHIVEAPKRFHNCPIVDEPLKELYRTGSNKSILQKYVSYCASTPLNGSSPPWMIHVVSYISREDGLREKTCLVIRMHRTLIKNREVSGALRELFLNSSVSTLDGERYQGVVLSTETRDRFDSSEQSEVDWKKVQIWKSIDIKKLYLKIKKIGLAHQKSFTVWINLRLKQLEFHSKTAVTLLILVDAKAALIQSLSNLEVFVLTSLSTFAYHLGKMIMSLQAFAAMPMIILISFLRRNQLKTLGLQRNAVPDRRLISWSDLLYGDLVDEICEKGGGISPENVLMIACSCALSDYYQLNNMPIPGKIGFTLSNAEGPLCSSNMQKAVHLPGHVKGAQTAFKNFKNLEEKMKNYPEWKMLGLLYISKYLPFILPSWVAYKVQMSIVSCYPFSFTHVNLKTDMMSDSIRQLFGEVVEDFTFWSSPPSSDLGVSITLVRYTDKMRLFVMSPFQSMDTVLTHRCNQYLIKIAEEVGVERNKIPYSRRSSPSSTSCSTPLPSLSFLNSPDNSLSLAALKRSTSLENAHFE